MKYEFIAAAGISMLGIEELRKIVKLFQTFEGKKASKRKEAAALFFKAYRGHHMWGSK